MLTRSFLKISSIILLTAYSCKRSVEIPPYLEGLENLTIYNADQNNVNPIQLNREVVFGDTDAVLLGRMVDTAIDEDGNIFIGDWDANKIRVFDKEGSFLGDIGREGSGPGEFRSIYYMGIAGGKLHVYDFNQQRMSIFSTETFELQSILSLQFEDERDADLSIWTADSFHILHDGNYLMHFVPGLLETEDDLRNQHLYLVSSEGRIISDLILELPWGREFLTDTDPPRVIMMPYARKKLLNISDNSIYTLWTEDLAVKEYDMDGTYRSAFYHPVNKSELTRQVILSRKEFDDPQSQQMIRNVTLPNTWPAVQDFIMDDKKRFWVSVHNREQSLNEWWVLQEDGELISRFSWPENRRIRHVKNGNMYVYESDEETGLDQVARYSFEMEM